MFPASLSQYDRIYLHDFEFRQPAGERIQDVWCLHAYEWRTGETIALWHDELRPYKPPYPINETTLFVSHYSSAEAACHLALHWPLGATVDFYVEFRARTNGLKLPCGRSLLGALAFFGLPSMFDALQKDAMHALAQRGGPHSAQEREELMSGCRKDVEALKVLFPVMAPHLDLPRALLRGKFMCCAAKIEQAGIPINTRALKIVNQNLPALLDRLIERVDKNFGFYDKQTFKYDRFAPVGKRSWRTGFLAANKDGSVIYHR